MRHVYLTLIATFVLSIASVPASARDVYSLDQNWRFHLGDIAAQAGTDQRAATPPPAEADYSDQDWKLVDVPHDYVIEGTCANGDRDFLEHGGLPLNVGWYRRSIEMPESAAGKIAWIEFDGVYRDSSYWIDGTPVGNHTSGFIGYRINLGPVTPGHKAMLAFRVDPQNPEGWWYDGGGIYRHVKLVLVNPPWGVFVHATVPDPGNGTQAPATVQVSAELNNETSDAQQIDIAYEIIDDQGTVVAKHDGKLKIAVGSSTDQAALSLDKARLWSCEHPVLYRLRTTLRRGDEILDQIETPFGLRNAHFDPERGFFLNGQHVLIHGVCIHQDAPGVGVALPDRLMAWRLERLKAIGVNAIRSHHALLPAIRSI